MEWGKGTHRVVVPNKRDGYVNATAAVASELDFQEKKSQCPSTFYVMLRYGVRFFSLENLCLAVQRARVVGTKVIYVVTIANVCTRALNFFLREFVPGCTARARSWYTPASALLCICVYLCV